MKRRDLQEFGAAEAVPLSSEELALVRACRGLDIAPSLAGPGTWDLTAKHFVGIVGGPTIEIRIHPKVPVARLMALIEYSGREPEWTDHDPGVGEGEDLGDWMARSLYRQTELALRCGVRQDYVHREDTLMTLRGRPRIADQLGRRFAMPVPLEVAYDDFTVDIPENRLLRTAASRMLAVPAVSPASRGRLARLVAKLEGVGELTRGAPLPPVAFTRLNERYRPAVELARLILRATSIEVTHGRTAGVSFLVDMNAVFESFLARALTAALPAGVEVVCAQHRDRLDEAGQLAIRPDLTWWDDGRCRAVIDAKYKRLRAKGEAMVDDYQVLAYCLALEAPLGVLVYADGSGDGSFHTIRNADVRILVRRISLDGPLSSVLDRVARLARELRVTRLDMRTAGTNLTHWTGAAALRFSGDAVDP